MINGGGGWSGKPGWEGIPGPSPIRSPEGEVSGRGGPRNKKKALEAGVKGRRAGGEVRAETGRD